MVNVTIVTDDFKFFYTLKEKLNQQRNIKINHILVSEPIPNTSDIIVTDQYAVKQNNPDRKIFIPNSYNLLYLYSSILLMHHGKNHYLCIKIGIDPGKSIGFAAINEDDEILFTLEDYSANNIVAKVLSIDNNVKTQKLIVRVGIGGGEIKNEIIKKLEQSFVNRDDVIIEEVKEEFTTKPKKYFPEYAFIKNKNIISALLIAKRYQKEEE